MTDEQKQYILLHLSIFKKALKKEGLCFALIFDKGDFNESYLAIIDAQNISKNMEITLDILNEGLI